ncbi:PREDICTED: uncharacterized protein LOC106812361 [Priapulus caudatus]|uniref:Uncharacterized protein LOC106812361 n=1 Tax=Priapulus caudatus TaxID=37621 RepID=A0ABM1EHN1_PRICU|nr:PREDICTED: uncharacterized protein LOC106812361 [Priapulus caudatus]
MDSAVSTGERYLNQHLPAPPTGAQANQDAPSVEICVGFITAEIADSIEQQEQGQQHQRQQQQQQKQQQQQLRQFLSILERSHDLVSIQVPRLAEQASVVLHRTSHHPIEEIQHLLQLFVNALFALPGFSLLVFNEESRTLLRHVIPAADENHNSAAIDLMTSRGDDDARDHVNEPAITWSDDHREAALTIPAAARSSEEDDRSAAVGQAACGASATETHTWCVKSGVSLYDLAMTYAREAHLSTGAAENQPIAGASSLDDVIVTQLENVSDQQINNVNDQQMNNINDRQMSNVGDQQISNMSDQQMNNANDQQMNNMNDQQMNNVGDQQVNNVSDQQVNNVSDQQVNNVSDQQMNNVGDQQMNNESDQQMNNMVDQQMNNDGDQQINNVSDHDAHHVTEPHLDNATDTQLDHVMELHLDDMKSSQPDIVGDSLLDIVMESHLDTAGHTQLDTVTEFQQHSVIKSTHMQPMREHEQGEALTEHGAVEAAAGAACSTADHSIHTVPDSDATRGRSDRLVEGAHVSEKELAVTMAAVDARDRGTLMRQNQQEVTLDGRETPAVPLETGTSRRDDDSLKTNDYVVEPKDGGENKIQDDATFDNNKEKQNGGHELQQTTGSTAEQGELQPKTKPQIRRVLKTVITTKQEFLVVKKIQKKNKAPVEQASCDDKNSVEAKADHLHLDVKPSDKELERTNTVSDACNTASDDNTNRTKWNDVENSAETEISGENESVSSSLDVINASREGDSCDEANTCDQVEIDVDEVNKNQIISREHCNAGELTTTPRLATSDSDAGACPSSEATAAPPAHVETKHDEMGLERSDDKQQHTVDVRPTSDAHSQQHDVEAIMQVSTQQAEWHDSWTASPATDSSSIEKDTILCPQETRYDNVKTKPDELNREPKSSEITKSTAKVSHARNAPYCNIETMRYENTKVGEINQIQIIPNEPYNTEQTSSTAGSVVNSDSVLSQLQACSSGKSREAPLEHKDTEQETAGVKTLPAESGHAVDVSEALSNKHDDDAITHESTRHIDWNDPPASLHDHDHAHSYSDRDVETAADNKRIRHRRRLHRHDVGQQYSAVSYDNSSVTDDKHTRTDPLVPPMLRGEEQEEASRTEQETSRSSTEKQEGVLDNRVQRVAGEKEVNSIVKTDSESVTTTMDNDKDTSMGVEAPSMTQSADGKQARELQQRTSKGQQKTSREPQKTFKGPRKTFKGQQQIFKSSTEMQEAELTDHAHDQTVDRYTTDAKLTNTSADKQVTSRPDVIAALSVQPATAAVEIANRDGDGDARGNKQAPCDVQHMDSREAANVTRRKQSITRASAPPKPSSSETSNQPGADVSAHAHGRRAKPDVTTRDARRPPATTRRRDTNHVTNPEAGEAEGATATRAATAAKPRRSRNRPKRLTEEERPSQHQYKNSGAGKPAGEGGGEGGQTSKQLVKIGDPRSG